MKVVELWSLRRIEILIRTSTFICILDPKFVSEADFDQEIPGSMIRVSQE